MSSSRTLRNHDIVQLTLPTDGPAAAASGTITTAAAGSAGPSAKSRTYQARHAGPPGRQPPGIREWLASLRAGLLARPRVTLIRAAVATLAAAPLVLALGPMATTPTSASTTPKRIIALRWAEHRAGHWYCWGGTGPCFDCSGLVMKAYGHAGIGLPRTTYGMLHSSKLRKIRARNRQRGDLAFYGSGHVELVTNRGTFGALEPGTRIGWHHPSRWWHPTMYFRVRT